MDILSGFIINHAQTIGRKMRGYLMFNQIKEECGVFVIFSPNAVDVVNSCYYGLYALQHRGQESCGIALNDRGVIRHYRDLGLVPDTLTAERL